MSSKKRNAGIVAVLIALFGVVYAWWALGGLPLGLPPTGGDESEGEGTPVDMGVPGETGTPGTTGAPGTSDEASGGSSATSVEVGTEADNDEVVTDAAEAGDDGSSTVTGGAG